ncbi:MAG: MepB family protein [Aequorivita sp.]|nr:MepB family protein [Aequorivita sp.]
MNEIHKEIYRNCGLKISDFITEPESKEYSACQFQIDGRLVISRTAKITPKKVGQFVTFWNRNTKGITQPFSEKDNFQFYIINVQMENRMGQFVFPKSILITKGIVTTEKKDGKRGFRVYPDWDTTNNKQAEKTQQWQLDYFYETQQTPDLERIKELYK